MTGLAVTISSKNISKSTLKADTKRAWADYVRDRWGNHVLAQVQSEWDLTEGEARGVVYGTASQKTIDKIENHKNGGVMLALDLLCRRFRTTLEELATKLEEKEAHARDLEEARIERRGRALRYLARAEGRSEEVSAQVAAEGRRGGEQ